MATPPDRTIALSLSPRDSSRAARLASALAAKSEGQDLLFVSQALILCGLPYSQTDERRITREARTARGRVRVTFQAMLDDVPMPFGKDAVLLSYITTLALLADSPIVNFANAKDYMDQFGEDKGGRTYRLFAERWRRLAGLVIAVERYSTGSHDTDLKVVIKNARLPSRSSLMAARSGFESFVGLQPYYSVTLGTDFWSDLKATAVPLLLPVMRAFSNRPLAWHFVQYLHWQSYVAQAAATDYGHPGSARVDWAELRMMLGSATKHEKQLRRELRAVISDLKLVWPELNARFDGTTLCIAPPDNGVLLVENSEELRNKRVVRQWKRFLAREARLTL